MSDLEILLTLITVIAGLGLVDLLQSFRQLLHPLVEVEWHWIPVAWTGYALLTVVEQWLNFAHLLRQDVFASSQAAYLVVIAVSLFLYLVCTFALPDLDTSNPASRKDPTEISDRFGDDTINLKSFYFSQTHRNKFFGACLLGTFAVGVAGFIAGSDLSMYRRITRAIGGGWNLIFATLFAVSIITRYYWVHSVIVVLAVGIMGLLSFG